MNRERKIKLLVVTEASQTGAPILLLNVLTLLKDSAEFEIRVLIKRHDKLAPEFARHFKTYVLKGRYYQIRNANLFIRLIRFIGSVFNRILYYPAFLGTDVILSNTIVNGSIIKELQLISKNIICYVHELETSILNWPNKNDIEISLKKSKLFIAPSVVILENLIKNHGILKSKTRLLETFIPSPKKDITEQKRLELRNRFLRNYNLKDDVFMVVGMGTADIRKGIDLFLDTAALANTDNCSIVFVWIGPFANSEIETYALGRKRTEPDLSKVVFTGPVPPDTENLYPFDLFFLSSREDPYPLVVLEAAAAKLPTICFAGSGGIVEFVEGGAGWIIDDFSVDKAAKSIISLTSSKALVLRAGEVANSKVKQKHSNTEQTKMNLKEIINSVL